MKKLLNCLALPVLLASFSTSATAMVWGQSNWGEANWGIDEVRESVPPPEGSIPMATKVRSVSGTSTDASISAGAYAANGAPAYSNSFTTGDYISIIAEVRPDSSDVGTNGELIVVVLSLISGGQQWSYLNTDGNFEAWDRKLSSLGPAQIKEPLEETNAITIFEGELQAGRHLMAVGYQSVSGRLIYTAKAISIIVND